MARIWDPSPCPYLNPNALGCIYNIYIRYGQSSDATGGYIATVHGITEFRPSLDGYYSVVAGYSGRFSNLSDAAIVHYKSDIDTTPGLTTERFYEIRTNRCTDISAGQSCSVLCGAPRQKNVTGGACRADGAVIVHQRARYDGYECIATSDTNYVEVDVFCQVR